MKNKVFFSYFSQKIKKINFSSLLIGILLGGISGYAYYYFVGCSSGQCQISSDPINMTLYGMLMGAVLFLKNKK